MTQADYDDYLDSVDSEELAVTRAQDVATTLKQEQLMLGKWNSNSTHVLHRLKRFLGLTSAC